MAEIGKPLRRITYEPKEVPVPTPEKEPVRTPEKEPARSAR